jgi:hypothetical protein
MSHPTTPPTRECIDPTSTRRISTNRNPIEAAIELVESHEPGASFSDRENAKLRWRVILVVRVDKHSDRETTIVSTREDDCLSGLQGRLRYKRESTRRGIYQHLVLVRSPATRNSVEQRLLNSAGIYSVCEVYRFRSTQCIAVTVVSVRNQPASTDPFHTVLSRNHRTVVRFDIMLRSFE